MIIRSFPLVSVMQMSIIFQVVYPQITMCRVKFTIIKALHIPPGAVKLSKE